PLPGSSVNLLLAALCQGARDAGGEAEHVRCAELDVKACQACGPDATPGYCVFHDGMDRVYALLERAHAVAVGSPIYFDTVSAQLKLVMDRCNCVTPLLRLPDGGEGFHPRWERTRRGVFVTACSTRHRYDLAEHSVRGFLKWIGAKWEETIAWQHDDNQAGSVTRAPQLLERARGLGRRLIESAPLVNEGRSR
ncbi:MAG: flavodoxin family protein, partial [Candidatus Eisenbacteria bacterium]|nr:flavodoxin family protein [Candidatus Eisenbacteria bacterium]